MPLRFDHQVAEIGILVVVEQIKMPYVEHIVFIYCLPRYVDFSPVLAAYKAIIGLILCTHDAEPPYVLNDLRVLDKSLDRRNGTHCQLFKRVCQLIFRRDAIKELFQMVRMCLQYLFHLVCRIACVVLKCSFATSVNISLPDSAASSRPTAIIAGSEAPFGSTLPTRLDNCSNCCTNLAHARMEAAATAISSSARGRCTIVIERPFSLNAWSIYDSSPNWSITASLPGTFSSICSRVQACPHASRRFKCWILLYNSL